MKASSILTALIIITTALVAGAFLTGCEDDSGSGHTLDIEPVSVTISTVTVTNVLFTASGGEPPYTWTVNDGALGSVVDAGDTAIYTSTATNGQNFVTVTDTESNSVSATINQM